MEKTCPDLRWGDVNPRPILTDDSVIKLRSHLGHSILVDAMVGSQTQVFLIQPVKLRARDLPRFSFEAAGIHQSAPLRKKERLHSLLQKIDQMNKGKRGSQQRDRLLKIRKLGRQPLRIQPASFDVISTWLGSEAFSDDLHHMREGGGGGFFGRR